ncbi:serine hydrolase [Sphingomonas sp. CJ99]
MARWQGLTHWLALAALLAMPIIAGSAAASPQTATPIDAPSPRGTALDRRIALLDALFTGGGDYASTFTEAFRAEVPEARWRALAAQVVAAIGAPTGVESREEEGPNGARLRFGFERGIASLRIAVEPGDQGRISGLLITNTEPRNDSADRIVADVAGLPGAAGIAVWRLDGVRPEPLLAHAADRAGPIGSAFKLWVLAELSRQVAAGERRWADVVPLGQPSLPSGVTQDWPAASPVTLHTLAVQMISISDNTATDTLIDALGRARIDAMVGRAGVADADRTLPLLTTMEAFRLKALARASEVPERWDTLAPAARRQLIQDRSARLASTRFDGTLFADGPLRTDIEWIASPADMARTLDWLRRNGGQETMAILAVNPGTGVADRFEWVGFKGGSEPGVLSLNYLVRTKSGQWFAVTGQWHNPGGEVSEARFAAIMNRALTLISRPVQP